MHSISRYSLAAAWLLAAAIALTAFNPGRSLGDSGAVVEVHPAGYAGGARCAQCHSHEAAAWINSHHANSMQVAANTPISQQFDGKARGTKGSAFTPFMRAGKPVARIEGADGKPADFPVAFAFGVYPLQQYLAPLPGGRYQALPFAWDRRPKEEGGQRWFSLYPESEIAPGDALHWTGRNQTWNSMCADCHSTGLRKGYDAAAGAYKTTWSDISVACEACHGPGAGHVAWADAGGRPDVANKGFTARLKEAGGAWGDFDGRGIRRWAGPDRRGLIDRCASCHARRRTLREDSEPGQPPLNTHSVALLDDELYHADGQIKDEVFEYGSFLQSRMSRAQVVCTDCHAPHSLSLKASGNALCAQCHDAERFDTPAHHHHAPGGDSAKCVACHMPAKTYMGVHVRHDHSFRLPAPARSAALGAPDPCVACHSDRGADWAEAALTSWTGGRRRAGSAFADALALGRRRGAGAQQALISAASDKENPPIARATALALLARSPGAPALAALRDGLTDSDPFVRLGAIRGIAPYSGLEQRRSLPPLLRDPMLAVRNEAARQLAPFFDPGWPTNLQNALRLGLDEWIASEQASAERPETALNLGSLWAELGDAVKAEAAFKDALAQDPRFTSAALNLADLYRSQQREDEAEKVLRGAVVSAPDDAEARYALGMCLVRRGRRDLALSELERATVLKPEDPRIAYAFGLALHEGGDRSRALSVLDQAHTRVPDDRDLLVALVAFTREMGDVSRAVHYGRLLASLDGGQRRGADLRELDPNR